jgi:proteasome assembly chaperone (PAC2) family protein
MEELVIQYRPSVERPAMILGLTGWMDGGSVSTGTVGYLIDKLGAASFAEIKPFDFYILNFPLAAIPLSIQADEGRAVLTSVNPMEVAAIFRPHAKIEDGVVKELRYPRNEFFCAERARAILFLGEEPHLRWGAYCEHLFRVAEEFGVTEIYFVGSVAAPLPHTREPRLRASVAKEEQKARLASLGVGFADYHGPASLITSLCFHAPQRGLQVTSLVVEVPHYPFLEMPAYPRSILRTASALNDLLGLGLDLDDLRRSSEVVEGKLNALAEENETFRELLAKLEEAYDQEELSPDTELLKRLIDGVDLREDDEVN